MRLLLALPCVSARFLALQGGGIRALATDAGLLAGLGPIDFEGVSSVSGSSWFAAELFYSERFASLLQGMRTSPEEASELFDEEWIHPWLLATGVQESKFDGLLTLVRLWVKAVLGTADEDTIFLAQFFLSTGFTWDHFVDVLFNATAGLSDTVLMGSKPTTNSVRYWLVDHTVLVPKDEACIVQGKLLLPHVSYTAGAAIPNFLPAKFSVQLGAGLNSSAPYPYLATTQAIQFAYQGTWPFEHLAASSPAFVRDLANGSTERHSGSLPVARCAAASSAVLAASALSNVASLTAAEFGAEVAVWMGLSGFHQAQKLVQQLMGGSGAWQQLVSQGVHALMDGGFSDGTGIASAVAAGAQEVVVVLNSYSTNEAEYVAQLFPGGRVVKPQVPPELFPVFATPTAAEVTKAFASFQELQVAKGSQFLKVIALGTLQTTTAENGWFGIPSGRKVTLHVINVASELSIGFFANFNHYGALIEEILLTLKQKANRPHVEHLKRLMGAMREELV